MEENNLVGQKSSSSNGFTFCEDILCDEFSITGSYMRMPCGKCGHVHPANFADYSKTPHEVYQEQRANGFSFEDMLEKDRDYWFNWLCANHKVVGAQKIKAEAEKLSREDMLLNIVLALGFPTR